MKTKIDIISGFLGSGKTTLIKKLLEEKLIQDVYVVLLLANLEKPLKKL